MGGRPSRGVLERRLRDTDAARRDVNPASLQSAHDLREPSALEAADQVGGRNDVVLEEELDGVDALVA